MIPRPPYYTIFDALRKNGFPLGISEYKSLVEILLDYKQYQPAEGLIAKSDLYDICKTLWLKPNQVPIIFETIFNEQYERLITVNKKSAETQPPGIGDTSKDSTGASDTATTQAAPEKPVSETADQPVPQNKPDTAQPRGARLILGPGQGAYQHFKSKSSKEADRRFLFSENYFPVTLREIQQLFGHLPEKKQQKAEQEIDIDATIRSIADNGYLVEAVYKTEEEILNTLVMLHDQKGSMVAFEQLSAMLTSAAQQLFYQEKKARNRNTTYYFQNAVEKYIYLNKANTDFMETNAFVNFLRAKKALLVIVSDAGAARGSNSDIRVRLSIRMLMTLQKITGRIVWLNPMPEERWINTSAERIAAFVPMFSIDRKGLQQAAEALRGKQVKTN